MIASLLLSPARALIYLAGRLAPPPRHAELAREAQRRALLCDLAFAHVALMPRGSLDLNRHLAIREALHSLRASL